MSIGWKYSFFLSFSILTISNPLSFSSTHAERMWTNHLLWNFFYHVFIFFSKFVYEGSKSSRISWHFLVFNSLKKFCPRIVSILFSSWLNIFFCSIWKLLNCVVEWLFKLPFKNFQVFFKAVNFFWNHKIHHNYFNFIKTFWGVVFRIKTVIKNIHTATIVNSIFQLTSCIA